MQTCIAGFYYFSECIVPLSKLQNTYIVGHRQGDSLNIPTIIVKNIGLEFNCYDYFVKNIWDKKSDVLFCHDDIIIKDISFINDIENTKGDIVMVWHSEKQKRQNLAHGRMFKCSCNYLNSNNGFWYDETNNGNVSHADGGNKAIEKLYRDSKNIMKHFYTDKIKIGSRGKIQQ
jgi:hypothetical protein